MWARGGWGHRGGRLWGPLLTPGWRMLEMVGGFFPPPAVSGFKTVVPFISQIATLPLVSRHRTSLFPSPLKSPVPTIDHVVGTFPTPAVSGFKTGAPFISQIAPLPLVSSPTTSLLPSPLSSPAPSLHQSLGPTP